MAFGEDARSHATAILSTDTMASVGITWNHTCGASANKLIVAVGIGSNSAGADGRNIASVTYNGVACSQVVEADDGNFEHCEIWELNSPPTGSAFAIVIKTIADGGTAQVAAGAISFNDASATNRATNAANGTSSNPTVSVTSESGDICIDAYASDVGNGATSTPAGADAVWEDEDVNGDSDFGSQKVVASGTSTAMTWTSASSPEPWALCAVALKPVGGSNATASPTTATATAAVGTATPDPRPAPPYTLTRITGFVSANGLWLPDRLRTGRVISIPQRGRQRRVLRRAA